MAKNRLVEATLVASSNKSLNQVGSIAFKASQERKEVLNNKMANLAEKRDKEMALKTIEKENHEKGQTMLEAKTNQNNQTIAGGFEQGGSVDKPSKEADQRFDCIYDNSPLGFEKSISPPIKKMKAQNPLGDINMGDETNKKSTYISKFLNKDIKWKIIALLH